jgi:hypothetical protein
MALIKKQKMSKIEKKRNERTNSVGTVSVTDVGNH